MKHRMLGTELFIQIITKNDKKLDETNNVLNIEKHGINFKNIFSKSCQET